MTLTSICLETCGYYTKIKLLKGRVDDDFDQTTAKYFFTKIIL